MSGPIQLSLYPHKGWALLCLGKLLVSDHDGLPSVRASRRGALALLARSAKGERAWLSSYAVPVRVTVHPPDPASGLPTYSIG